MFGAVGAVSHIRNPIIAASLIAKQQEIVDPNGLIPPCVLVSTGAEKWAKNMGVQMCDPEDLISDKAKSVWQKANKFLSAKRELTPSEVSMDTVGAVSVSVKMCK